MSMQGLLLDTHVWLWYAEGISGRLAGPALDAIEEARMDQRLFIATISVWEISMLAAKGRIRLSAPLDTWISQALSLPGLRQQTLDAQSALESTRLPGSPHGDPADRFVMAMARVHGLTLATADAKIHEYARAGYLDVMRV
jgi:PIN domain nuclease of toxin-antitoxin system